MHFNLKRACYLLVLLVVGFIAAVGIAGLTSILMYGF